MKFALLGWNSQIAPLLRAVSADSRHSFTTAAEIPEDSLSELLAAAPNGALLVYDMPLLVEQGPEALLGWDAIVVVDASDGVRLERLRARGMGADDARRRMDAQASREDRLAVATVILDNSGDVAALEEQVGHLWEDLRRQRT